MSCWSDKFSAAADVFPTAALLPADAEKKIEYALVEIAPHPRAELLKVGQRQPVLQHARVSGHGASSVRVHFGWLPESFHHPRLEVLERLAERHIVTFRTDTLSAVVFYLDGERVRSVLPLHSPN